MCMSLHPAKPLPDMTDDGVTPVIVVPDRINANLVHIALTDYADHCAAIVGHIAQCPNTPDDIRESWLDYGVQMANRIDALLGGIVGQHTGADAGTDFRPA